MSGAVQVALFLGRPVDKARTPGVFDAWAAATSTPARMVALSLPDAALAPTLAALRGWDNALGAVVTYPYKGAAFSFLDTADEAATFCRACNVVRRLPDGRLHGTITDGIGCVGAARAEGARFERADMLLVGAGGAGSAIAFEAARAGVARLVVHDIEPGRAATLCTAVTKAFPTCTASPEPPNGFRFDIVCNATPLGMGGEAAHPWPLSTCHRDSLVIDVVPTPAMTPWLTEAAARGLRVQTGPAMVVGQFPHVVANLYGISPADVPRTE